MTSLTSIAERSGLLSEQDLRWLHRLVTDFQLLADLAIGDIVLWLPTGDGDGYIAAQHARLNRRTQTNHFVRVDALARLFGEEGAHRILHRRHTGHTTDQNYGVDVFGFQPRVFKRGATGVNRPLD